MCLAFNIDLNNAVVPSELASRGTLAVRIIPAAGSQRKLSLFLFGVKH